MSGDLELQDWEVGFSAAKPPLHDECVKKGHALRKKAEEHLKSVSKISSFARNVKFDHACQLYEDAATQFKVGGFLFFCSFSFSFPFCLFPCLFLTSLSVDTKNKLLACWKWWRKSAVDSRTKESIRACSLLPYFVTKSHFLTFFCFSR